MECKIAQQLSKEMSQAHSRVQAGIGTWAEYEQARDAYYNHILNCPKCSGKDEQ